MENLVTETAADQGLTVSAEDDTRLVSALPTNDAEEVVLEELTKNTVNAVNAEAPWADVIADLAHGIESLTKDDARAQLLELEEDQEKTFFEIGLDPMVGVLFAQDPRDGVQLGPAEVFDLGPRDAGFDDGVGNWIHARALLRLMAVFFLTQPVQ